MSAASATDTYYRGLTAWQAGEHRTAERCFRSVLAARPRHPAALHHLGLVAQATGRQRLAMRLLENACRLEPRNAQFAFNLGNCRFEAGRNDEAIAAWERSAQLDPDDDEPWRNIGLTCAETGDLARAGEAFRKVLAITPDAHDVCRRLSAIARRSGCAEEARAWTARAAALARDPDALVRLAEAKMRSGRVGPAVALLRRAAAFRPSDAGRAFRLAEWLTYLGRTREARSACRRVLSIEPGHAGAGFLTDVLQGRTPTHPPPGTVATLFDGFADRFDEQLVHQLRYRGPALIWQGVRRVFRARGRRAAGLDILDAGCGTGLAASLLRPAARRLVGIDLSQGMLAKARERAAYDRLLCGDLVDHLRRTRSRYDVVFAADVFIYVGNLEPTMRAARRALRPGGLLAFSLELKDGDGYCLDRTQRYAHSLQHVRKLAGERGLSPCHVRRTAIRYESGFPVRSAVVLLGKP